MENIDANDAMVKSVWIKSQNARSKLSTYYNQLSGFNSEEDKLSRKRYLSTSTKSRDIHYREMIGLQQENCLYDSYVNDKARTIVTRWRLSNLILAVETGRYAKPIIPRNNRLCKICLVVEDEHHVLFQCPLYNNTRLKYSAIINSSDSVTKILNPETPQALYETSKLLNDIEKIHENFF